MIDDIIFQEINFKYRVAQKSVLIYKKKISRSKIHIKLYITKYKLFKSKIVVYASLHNHHN